MSCVSFDYCQGRVAQLVERRTVELLGGVVVEGVGLNPVRCKKIFIIIVSVSFIFLTVLVVHCLY